MITVEQQLENTRNLIFKTEFKDIAYDQDNILSKCKRCGKEAWLPEDVKHKKDCDVGQSLAQ